MKNILQTMLLLLLFVAGVQAQEDMISTPLTFEAVEAGTITINNPNGRNFEYKLNDAEWTATFTDETIEIEVEANDVVQFRGDNTTLADDNEYGIGTNFTATGNCYVYGNVMSLLSSTDFASATEVTEPYCFMGLFSSPDFEPNATILNHRTYDIVLPATSVSEYGYGFMFNGCQGITRAPELPATTLADYCYDDMYAGCTSLVSVPDFPAADLTDIWGSYTFMFAGCISLTTAPKLPATLLGPSCYDGIFMDCASLVNAPELPANTMVESCYVEMFMGCTSLETAPVLPATTLANFCYGLMFSDCSNLNSVTCLATDISADNCTFNWMENVPEGGTFYKSSDMEDWTTGIGGIPEGWTVEDYSASGLYATPLTFQAITDGDLTFNLQYYDSHPLTDIEYQVNGGEWTTYIWSTPIAVVEGDLVAFRGDNEAYNGNGGYEVHIVSTADVYVYGNIMSLVHSQDFATNFTMTGSFNFGNLFCAGYGEMHTPILNTTIQNHPEYDLLLPATTLTNMCYWGMFSGCQGLTRAPELPATEMTVACYAEMFRATGLTKAPVLPCTAMTPYSYDPDTWEEHGSIDCYMEMFRDCVNLTEAPELPATVLTHGVYQFMFFGCTSLEKAPVLPAPLVADLAYSNMFEGCTNLNYVKCLATDFEINPDFGNAPEDNVSNWLNNVAATGTFIMAPGMTGWLLDSPSGIPEGWTTYGHVFQTEGNWDVAANWNSGTMPADGSNVVIASNVIVPSNYVANAGNVLVEDGATLTIADGGQLKHNNDVHGTMQKFIAGYGAENENTNLGYNLLKSPVSGYLNLAQAIDAGMVNGTVEAPDYDGVDLYVFQQAGSNFPDDDLEWRNMRLLDNHFASIGILPGWGYLYANRNDVTLSFTTHDDQLFPATSTDVYVPAIRSGGTFIGWNLIGNPFTCDAYLASGRDFYRMNDAGNDIVLATDNIIKPCEGIFIVVAAENDPDPFVVGQFTIENMADICFTTTEPQSSGSRGLLDIKVSHDNQLADIARVRFGKGGMLGKMVLSDKSTRLSISQNDKDCSVVYSDAQDEIPVNFKAVENGNYTLNVNAKDVDVKYLHLIDNLTGNDIDLLATPNYTFEAKTTDYESRFRLVFDAKKNGVSVGSDTFAFVNNGEIVITDDVEGAILQVIDVMGRILVCRDAIDRVSTEGFKPGVYMLRLVNGNDVKTQKIVVK